MLLDKYTPKTSKELIGNRLAAAQLAGFLKQWKKGQAALLTGGAGTGKTLAARLVAREMGYEVVEAGADEQRGRAETDALLQASKQSGLVSKKKMFLIDEIESMESVKAAAELTAGSSHPVVLVAKDAYTSKMRVLRGICTTIKFTKVRADSIGRFLADVAEKEKLKCDAGQIEQVALQCGGDVRAALIDLETLCAGSPDISHIGHREQAQGVFEAVRVIFKTSSIETAMIALNSAEDPEELHRWIAENVAEEYDDAGDVARAYDALSRADIFYSRIIRRQSWSLQKYFLELSAAGVAVAKKSQYKKFVKYARPRFRRKNNEALRKVAGKLHVSARKAAAYRQLIKTMRSSAMLEELGITKEEVREL